MYYFSINLIFFVIMVILNYYVVLCFVFTVRYSLACSRHSHPIPGITINMICAIYCKPVSQASAKNINVNVDVSCTRS